jgi:hypothetical protein
VVRLCRVGVPELNWFFVSILLSWFYFAFADGGKILGVFREARVELV